MSPDGGQELVYATASATDNSGVVRDGVRHPNDQILRLEVRGRRVRVERRPRRGLSSADRRLGADCDQSQRLFSNLLRLSDRVRQYRALSCAGCPKPTAVQSA